MTHLQVDPPSYLKTPPPDGTLPDGTRHSACSPPSNTNSVTPPPPEIKQADRAKHRAHQMDSDDHDALLAVGQQRTAVGTPTSRPTPGITPLLSQIAAGRRPSSTPWQSKPQRQTVHEPTQPTTYRTLRPHSHTDRRVCQEFCVSGVI